ncbi:MAG: hypothetical protein QHH13_05125 [Melioribacter sp.]|uniref:hypothetical protein n=1 Tax=Rosettibacter primus TaxID=3111523 RepID=UPI00247D8711|nr:hypothetical protein [Melioribacter sp.]
MDAVFNPAQIHTLNQILDELKFALNSLKEKEINKIIISLIKNSAIDTYENKKQIVLDVNEFFKKKINDYKVKGFRRAFKDDFNSVINFSINLPDKIKNAYEYINKMSKQEKIEMLISILWGIIIFYAVSGGSDLEGGVPDLDIKLGGLGLHRSIWFHSIIAGFTLEFIMRLAFKTLLTVIDNLPENHHAVWDKLNDFIQKNQNLTVAAIWFGIAAHLIKDTGIIAGNFKSYSDLPASLSLEHHNLIMNANGVASALLGAGNIKKL